MITLSKIASIILCSAFCLIYLILYYVIEFCVLCFFLSLKYIFRERQELDLSSKWCILSLNTNIINSTYDIFSVRNLKRNTNKSLKEQLRERKRVTERQRNRETEKERIFFITGWNHSDSLKLDLERVLGAKI